MIMAENKFQENYMDRIYFKEQVMEWARKIKVKPARLRIQKMRNKWASCSSSGCVTFNEALLGGDTELRDYVIVHEMAHLIEPNHSRAFWDIVSRYRLAERARGYLMAIVHTV